MPAIVAAFLAAATLSVPDSAAIDAATAAIFAPYHGETTDKAPWERDIWTREVRVLVTHWEAVQPKDEPDALNDGDWLCQCQDWDPKAFRMTIRSREPIGPDRVKVTVVLDLGDSVPRDTFLTFAREEGRWLIDELYTEWHSDGIRAALRQTIAEDEALLKVAS